MQSPLNPKIMYVFWDLLPLYQRITIKLPYIAATPHPPLALPCPTKKKTKMYKKQLTSIIML